MILDVMFQGKDSKWPEFNKWIESLGLSATQQKLTPQDEAVESARIISKFDSISKDILKQRAQGQV